MPFGHRAVCLVKRCGWYSDRTEKDSEASAIAILRGHHRAVHPVPIYVYTEPAADPERSNR